MTAGPLAVSGPSLVQQDENEAALAALLSLQRIRAAALEKDSPKPKALIWHKSQCLIRKDTFRAGCVD